MSSPMSGGDRQASEPAQDGLAHDAAPALLVRYTSGSAVEPPPGLAARIVERVIHAPLPADPRYFVSRLARLDGRGAARELRYATRAIADRRSPLLLRLQALALVMVVGLATGAIGVAGAVTVGPLIDDLARPSTRQADDGRTGPGVTASPTPRPSPDAPAASAPAVSGPARGRASDRAGGSSDRRPGSRASVQHAIEQSDRAPAVQARTPRPEPAATRRQSASRRSGTTSGDPAFGMADAPRNADGRDEPEPRER